MPKLATLRFTVPAVKSDEARGRWGAWLRKERLKRGLSPEQVREMLSARGFRVGESSYAEWESGYKQPSRDAKPHLMALWGSEPPELPVDAGTDFSALVAALSSQTEALNRLADQLAHRSTDDLRAVAALAVEATIRGLAEQGRLAAPGGRLPQRAERGRNQ